MLWKLVTLGAAAYALWSFLRRAIAVAAPSAPPKGGAEEYARCPRCGAWRPAGEDCACRLPPVP
jgi:hypothetical protein